MAQAAPEHLVFGGCDTVELARSFGTPLYVLDVEAVRARMRAYRAALGSWKAGFHVSFACKAFCCKAMCHMAHDEGFGLDVVSGGELHTALSAGVPAEKITLHGNNKSAEEIDMALRSGVGRLVCDGLDDLDLLEERSRALGLGIRVLLRTNPVVKASTHEYVQTANAASKFGFLLGGATLREAIIRLKNHGALPLAGLHVHVGSQLMDAGAHRDAIASSLKYLSEIKEETGYFPPEFNIGGGLGAAYTDADAPMAIEPFVASILAAIDEACQRHDLPRPRLLMEPGRSLVAEAGLTLYTVGTIKEEVPGRRFLSIDGGMSDNPRPALYGARHRAVIANRMGIPPAQTVTVAGKACESGDILIRDIALPPARRGDILAVFTTGAYNFSMASNYNRHCRPAVVFVSKGKAALAVRRETHDDLVARDLMPDGL